MTSVPKQIRLLEGKAMLNSQNSSEEYLSGRCQAYMTLCKLFTIKYYLNQSGNT